MYNGVLFRHTKEGNLPFMEMNDLELYAIWNLKYPNL